MIPFQHQRRPVPACGGRGGNIIVAGSSITHEASSPLGSSTWRRGRSSFAGRSRDDLQRQQRWCSSTPTSHLHPVTAPPPSAPHAHTSVVSRHQLRGDWRAAASRSDTTRRHSRKKMREKGRKSDGICGASEWPKILACERVKKRDVGEWLRPRRGTWPASFAWMCEACELGRSAVWKRFPYKKRGRSTSG